MVSGAAGPSFIHAVHVAAISEGRHPSSTAKATARGGLEGASGLAMGTPATGAGSITGTVGASAPIGPGLTIILGFKGTAGSRRGVAAPPSGVITTPEEAARGPPLVTPIVTPIGGEPRQGVMGISAITARPAEV